MRAHSSFDHILIHRWTGIIKWYFLGKFLSSRHFARKYFDTGISKQLVKVVVKIFNEKRSSMMIEISSNIWDLYFSQFVRNIAIAEGDMLSTLLTTFHDNRFAIFYKLRNYRVFIYHKARPDFSKCASGILKVFQLKIFVNRHTLQIKITPKFIMFKNNTTNSLQSSFILRLTRLNALRPVAFVTKKNASRPFSTKYLVEQFIVFPYLGFSSGPPSTVKIITFFSSCLSV